MTTLRSRRWAFGSPLAVAVLLALGACGDDADEASGVASASGDATAGAAEGSEPLAEDDQVLAFAECMRDNGVDIPDPGTGQEGLAEAFQEVAGDVDRAALDQAFNACQDLLPQFEQSGPHEETDMLDLAECLRAEGLDVSDEPFGDIHSGDIDQTELNAAMEVCRSELLGEDT
jgi:hypothetical protein